MKPRLKDLKFVFPPGPEDQEVDSSQDKYKYQSADQSKCLGGYLPDYKGTGCICEILC